MSDQEQLPNSEVKAEDSWPADLSYPSKVVSAGNKLEKKIVVPKEPEVPHGARLKLRRGGAMGHTGYHRPAEKNKWKKELDMEDGAVVAADVSELQNKVVQWKKPNGIVLQFIVWEVGPEEVEVREMKDMPNERTYIAKKVIPRQVLQQALENGNIEIVGTSPRGGIDEQLEVLTRLISQLFE